MVREQLVELSQALGLGNQPQQLIAMLQDFYLEVDQQLLQSTQGLMLPCKAGCDACCHESVFVSTPEFLYVANYLLSEVSLVQRQEICTQMSALAKQFEDEIEQLSYFPAGPERDEVAERVKFRCPLLLSEGRCGIYAARELNGRSFGNTWYGAKDQAYGCELTHQRLKIVGQKQVQERLLDSQQLRRKLVETVPGTEIVQIYPYWFSKYQNYLLR